MSQPGRTRGTGACRRRKTRSKLGIHEPGGVCCARVWALRFPVGRTEAGIELCRSLTARWRESRKCNLMQLGHPCAGGSDGIHGDEPLSPAGVAEDAEHGNAAAPGVAEHVTAAHAERAPDGTDVLRIVLNARVSSHVHVIRCYTPAPLLLTS